MMKCLISIFALVFLSNVAFAQTTEPVQGIENQISTSVAEPKADEAKALPFKHAFVVNFIPLIGVVFNSPGVGFGYQYILNDHYALATNFFYQRRKVTDKYPDEVNTQFLSAGLEGRYKFSSFSEDGFYGGLGVVTSGAQGAVEMRSPFHNQTQKAETSYQWENSLVPRFGYLWVPKSNRSFGDFSVSYEPDSDVEYEYSRGVENQSSPTMELKKRNMSLNVSFLMGFVF